MVVWSWVVWSLRLGGWALGCFKGVGCEGCALDLFKPQRAPDAQRVAYASSLARPTRDPIRPLSASKRMGSKRRRASEERHSKRKGEPLKSENPPPEEMGFSSFSIKKRARREAPGAFFCSQDSIGFLKRVPEVRPGSGEALRQKP